MPKIKKPTLRQENRKLYFCWRNMKNRCQNPKHKKYKNYGGRGITICDTWQKFEGFFYDMAPTYKEGLSLERIDVNQGYYKNNCTWIKLAAQAKNRSNTTMITYQGQELRLAEVIEKYNLSYKAVWQRINRDKLDPEAALIKSIILKYPVNYPDLLKADIEKPLQLSFC